ncbi:Phosphatidate phosphatase LPIN1 [Triplophysa tibetana]|uniref:phosphatidate phosphatase n=1 Tax=Triplophysa tibetana TaxID=1572043 RepID=A0A5A9NLB0_9TELE|nr:Phosphatidate phosphatase LPIN1 [Triplophysa tibetana]KAA0711234.1 Phosphatidate phosphatase LPIN1 [Triplophysa tibetana]
MIAEDQVEEYEDEVEDEIFNSNETSWTWSQTMNYVGQLAGQVFVQVKELYRGLNPATLSGCIDVIVVRQSDGSLQCSPFHVRFGKMGVLRSREKVVDIEINGEPVSLQMKLGENGEAFFVKETESNEELVPSHLATSPIISEGSALMQAQMGKGTCRRPSESGSGASIQTLGPGQASGDSSMMKKRRKRRRKPKMDSMKREDNGDFSEDDDMFRIDLSSEDETKNTVSRAMSHQLFAEQVKGSSSSTTYTTEGNWSGGRRTGMEKTCCLPIPIKTGLSISCPQQTAMFPSTNSSPNGSLPSTPKSDSELLKNEGKTDNPEMLWTWGELPHAAKPSFLQAVPEPVVVAPGSIPPSDSTHFRAITRGVMIKSQDNVLHEFVPDLRSVEAACGHSIEVEAISAAAHLITDLEEGAHGISKTDSPSKRKDKRSRHLGSDGVYLDDITGLEPDVAALYFPKSDGAALLKGGTDLRSANQSPQSVGSSGMDSGVDSFSDQLGDLPHIAISLCGGLTENTEITREEFEERAVSFQEFADNPSIIDDPNLVVKIGTKYYNWTTAAPMVLAMQVFQMPLPKATVENIMKEKMPKKGGRWWFSWRGRNSNSKSESVSDQIENGDHSIGTDSVGRLKDDSSSSDDDSSGATQNSVLNQPEVLHSSGGHFYRKTLRLSSDQLVSLNLKDGPNDVVFSVTTQYQGTCRCEGTIYLWNWDDKIVISDIDGTITRSDTLGHILPTLGKDWTHQGIARLYHRVSQNGYKFMYCSARAIGMADMTRGYLHWVNERGTMLPMGPVLLSPSSLFSAFHREVIEKKPEKFKIECLTDIKNLFLPNKEPFYAAFGNRATDVYSYKEVGVPLNRIFTVNPKGELVQEHAKTNISSYGRLCEVVDHVFPPLTRGNPTDFPCSDTFSQFTFWRDQIPEVDKQDQQAESS